MLSRIIDCARERKEMRTEVCVLAAFVVLTSVVSSVPLSLEAMPVEQPLLKPDPEGIFCRYKNFSLSDACLEGGACAVKNVTSASDMCEQIYLHDHAVELPFMASNFTTPYLPISGCPANGVDHLHVPLMAFRTGNRYRSTVCSLTCGKLCERVADSETYRQGHMLRTMVPLCHCKQMVKTPLVKAAEQNATRVD